MSDQKLDDLFDQDIPSPDENAKKIAINSAMSEFSLGLESPARLMNNRKNWFSRAIKSFGSYLMTPQKNSRFNGTFVSIAVAFIAVSTYFLLPDSQKENSTIATIIEADNKSPIIKEVRLIALESQFDDTSVDETVASGTRAVIQNSIDSKRIQTGIVDGLSADDIDSVSHQSISKVLTSIEQKNSIVRPTPQSIKRQFQKSKQTVIQSPKTIRSRELSITPKPSSTNLEKYPEYETNSIKLVTEEPVSTFSIDVDTASYSLVRNQLNNGLLPKPNTVRAEELINYFDYSYPIPESRKRPFKPTITVLNSPWNKGKKLVHIGIKGYEIDANELPDSNLVFLLDVSGSMNTANKLPLVKQSINLLLDTLKPTDTVSLVVYAGAAGVVLEPTQVKNKTAVIQALQNLGAGGSTAGGKGIELAYQLAEQNFKKGSVNRIILATDGDFNVGASSNDALKQLVEHKRQNGVFLSVLGFGRNNYQDDMMQTLAQNGNGVAAYIDTLSEAKKVLVDEATSTLFTIAKDVKIQVEFNPATISEYRLVGYETRALKREDFNNNKVDAGDIGAGHTVTAIYEITLADSENQSIDKPRYTANQKNVTSKTTVSKTANSKENNNEYGFVKIRYKSPTDTQSKLIQQSISVDKNLQTNSEVLFSTAVAGFAQLLRNSNYTSNLEYADLIDVAQINKGDDEFGYRSEFIQLIRMAEIAKP